MPITRDELGVVPPANLRVWPIHAATLSKLTPSWSGAASDITR